MAYIYTFEQTMRRHNPKGRAGTEKIEIVKGGDSRILKLLCESFRPREMWYCGIICHQRRKRRSDGGFLNCNFVESFVMPGLYIWFSLMSTSEVKI